MKKMKKVNVSFNNQFNQFSFSKYDNEKFENHKGYPCRYISDFYNGGDEGYEIITGCPIFPEMPYYDTQLELIAKSFKKIFDLNTTTFKLNFEVSYNNYGSIILVFGVKHRKHFDKCIEIYENLMEMGVKGSDDLEGLMCDFSDVNNGIELNGDDDNSNIKRHLEALKKLGYGDSDDDIADSYNIDINLIKEIRKELENEN